MLVKIKSAVVVSWVKETYALRYRSKVHCHLVLEVARTVPSGLHLAPRAFSTGVVGSLGESFVWRIVFCNGTISSG
jgi:hypothetical protein